MEVLRRNPVTLQASDRGDFVVIRLVAGCCDGKYHTHLHGKESGLLGDGRTARDLLRIFLILSNQV
jgi:hypothetical protein